MYNYTDVLYGSLPLLYLLPRALLDASISHASRLLVARGDLFVLFKISFNPINV